MAALTPVLKVLQKIVKAHPKMAFTILSIILALCVFALNRVVTNGYLLTFLCLSVFRYLRLIVNTISYVTLTGRPRAETPQFTAKDVSVVVPTVFSNPEEVVACLQRILLCNPLEVIVVTSNALVPSVKSCCAANNIGPVQVIGVAKLNKRTQMVAALQQSVSGSIVCFADDDVFWPNAEFIDVMLACFEDSSVGAAGPSQRVQRNNFPNLWNFLGICYLERRNFNTGATNNIDGAVSTLSGRTSFYRSEIVQSDAFYDYFLNALNHDDDKNLTRWTFVQGWEIVLQFDEKACIETTLETTRKLFLNQCLRWARGHWRGNFRVMTTASYWFDRHIWSLYAIYIAQFQTPAILIDGGLAVSLYKALSSYSSTVRVLSMVFFAVWVFLTKIVKIIPHFLRHPADMKFIPAMVLFSYFHGFLNVYALATMNNKAWGNRTATVQPQASSSPTTTTSDVANTE